MDIERNALNVQKIIPWVSTEDLVNFFRKVPLENNNLRNQLALHHFLQTSDSTGSENYEKQIDDEARDILDVLEGVTYKEIKNTLNIFGNIHNRKEVAIRLLIHNNKQSLEEILNTINSKQKRKLNFADSGSDNSDDYLKIKIPKVDEDSQATIEDNLSDEVFNQPVTSSVINTEIPDSSTISFKGKGKGKAGAKKLFCNNGVINNTNKFFIITNSPVAGPSSGSDNFITPSSFSSVNNHLVIPKKQQDLPHNIVGNPSPSVSNNQPAAVQNNNNNQENDAYLNNNIPDGDNNNEDLLYAFNDNVLMLNNNLEEVLNNNIHIVEAEEPPVVINLANLVTPAKAAMERDLPTSIKAKDLPLLEETKSDSLPSTSKKVSIFNKPKNEFNLINYIKELTLASEEKIRQYCADRNLVTCLKPSSDELDSIVDHFLNRTTSESLDDFSFHSIGSDSDDVLSEGDPEETGKNANDRQAPIDLTISDQDKEFNSLEECENLVQPVCPINSVELKPSTSDNKAVVIDQKVTQRTMEIFPEACPNYIKRICTNKTLSDVDEIVTTILGTDGNYPKRPMLSPERDVDAEQQLEILIDFLPDADPTYLQMQCEKYANDPNGLKAFMENAIEIKNYPTKKEYLRKQQLSAQQRQYTTDFKVENFVQLFPNPTETFCDPKRKITLNASDQHYLAIFLRNKFDKLPVRDIAHMMVAHNNKPISCVKALTALLKSGHTIKTKRKRQALPDNMQNIPLLQEVAFIEHGDKIEQYLEEKVLKEKRERKEAKEMGLMQTCYCCYDEEIMPKDVFTCEGGCKFCRECIKKSTEVAMGDGKTDFPCLSNCDKQFNLQTLQNVLPPKMFSKLAQKKALAEVKAAGIEDLEMCPFCDFATIPYEADKIFRCLNPDCMKESCRLCKEPSHVPLRCDEVEKDEDVKTRTFIENQMTEALLRKCWKCQTKFFKEEGCNKMTCSCGAHMCYICGEAVKDYSHFNGIGGDKHHLCPLYSDTNTLNKQNVLKGAESAKAQVDASKLKIDPTSDIQKHYEDRAKQLPREGHMELLQQAHIRMPHHHGRPEHHHNQHVHFLAHNIGAIRVGQAEPFVPQHNNQVNPAVPRAHHHHHHHIPNARYRLPHAVLRIGDLFNEFLSSDDEED